MKIEIITFIPELFNCLKKGKIGRAIKNKSLNLKIYNIHDFSKDKRGSVDDKPYGGGPGMILKIDIVDKIIKKLKTKNSKIILLCPRGKLFNQKRAKSLSKEKHLIFICGRYEGYDERIRQLVDTEISIGDYVLTGGELASMVILDSVVRLLPGVVDKKESLKNESFSEDLLEYPQYTRPENYQPSSKTNKNMKVPKILLSGNHQEIKKWQKEQALKITQKYRPDLLK